MSLWTGKTIGNVEVGDLIARGGMAEVYFGEHITLDRKVAVKIMRNFVDGDPETRTRFDREARVIANLNHPNIIQLYDYDFVSGQPCIVMELVQGVSLGGYLRNLHKQGQKLPFNIIAKILTGLASAIDYAHKQNIVHRDIKPANILLRSKTGEAQLDQPLPEDVEPVLTDFGLVRLIDANTQTSTGTVSGTPAYMSPEQAHGDKVDGKTDIYALGVVLYEMLAGNVPFEAESSFGVLMKHMTEPPPPIPNITSDLQIVINRALAKDPANRYPTAKELVDEFITVFNGETLSVNTINYVDQIEKSAKPKSLSPIIIGLGILTIIVLAFLAFRPFASTRIDPDQPIGRTTFLDFNTVMDKVSLTFTNLPKLKSGTHYEVWLIAEGGEIRRNIGTVKMETDSQGQLIFLDQDQKNMFQLYDQVEITLETDNDPQPHQSSGNVIASSVFPPFALIHVRHILAAFEGAPDNTALIQGLWYSSFDVNETVLALQNAYDSHDEEQFRSLTTTLITQLVGNSNAQHHTTQPSTPESSDTPQYADAEINSDTIFGLLGSNDVNETGYIPNTISHIEFASQATDSTENIKAHGEHVLFCIYNMKGWSEQLLALAIEIQQTPFEDANLEMKLITMRTLSMQILSGVDTNGNEIIEPILSEGGADTAYEHAYYMADMPIFIGVNQIPEPLPSTHNP